MSLLLLGHLAQQYYMAKIYCLIYNIILILLCVRPRSDTATSQ
jgi:hypothetical protein